MSGDPKRPDPFYTSRNWAAIRQLVLQRDYFQCTKCGADISATGAARVDHILPRSTHPELERDLNNLAVCARGAIIEATARRAGVSASPVNGSSGSAR
jgi:5-methylcytosine-specific restriction endonuclease McrA